MNAKQFVGVYNPKYYSKIMRKPAASLIHSKTREFNPQRRSYVNTNEVDSDEIAEALLTMYISRSVRVDGTFYDVKSMQCVETTTKKWFITSSGVDKYMFLLEQSSRAQLLATGLFEPSAIVRQRHIEYFNKQFRDVRDVMSSLVCKLGIDDRLRLCSSILDAMSARDKSSNIPKMTHIKSGGKCAKRAVQVNREPHPIRTQTLPCFTYHDPSDTHLASFFVLGDSRTPGAAFVFLENKAKGKLGGRTKIVKMYTRVTKIGALLYPVGPREKRQKFAEEDDDFMELDDDHEEIDEWREESTSKKKGRKLRLDDDPEESDEWREESTSKKKGRKRGLDDDPEESDEWREKSTSIEKEGKKRRKFMKL